MKKLLSIILSLLVLISVAFVFSACDSNASADNPTESAENAETTAPKNSETVGQGEVNFVFKVVNIDASEKTFTVLTDKTTVGAALLDSGLISGDSGPYGLYVKTVNGVTLDYDKDGKYWAFYINDELSPKGVDMTEIKNGEVYTFKAE